MYDYERLLQEALLVLRIQWLLDEVAGEYPGAHPLPEPEEC
jgi:hypothetical protein